MFSARNARRKAPAWCLDSCTGAAVSPLPFIRLGTGLEGQSWAPIRSTTGVSRLVAFGTTPAKVGDELVEALRSQPGGPDNLRRHFEPGQAVVITQGPFAGLEAVYRMSDGESRVMVLLNILSKSVKLAIAPSSIRKAN